MVYDVAPVAHDAEDGPRIVLDVPAGHPTFNFDRIARALTSIVVSSEPRFAVGVFGGWGSGKSTLMEEIERRLRGTPDTLVVEFNAWRYEREPHLIVPLLDTLREALSDWAAELPADTPQRRAATEVARRVGRVVRALVRSTAVEIGVPGGPKLSLDPGKAVDALRDGEQDEGSSPQSLYFGAFTELRAAFEQVRNAGVARIVVFVDDLDRCLPHQALTVLESMKLFFDTPGFVFVVGLDERVVQSAVRSKFVGEQLADDEDQAQLERDYLKKMFQVPYTLPAVAPGQVDHLLEWLEQYGDLPSSQQEDLRNRVRRFLMHVTPEGGINPREAKRFINAYTINKMIRPDLEPEVLLALQTMDFRPEWESIYDNIVLTEPDTFSDAVRRFRDGDREAFEDLWPEIGRVPPELGRFLDSPDAVGLARPDLPVYVGFLESTRTSVSGMAEAMREVGLLRRYLRQVHDSVADQAGGPSADVSGTIGAAQDAVARLRSVGTFAEGKARRAGFEGSGFTRELDSLEQLLKGLSSPDAMNQAALERSRADADSLVGAIQTELRLVRRASAFSG
ncbi:KAP family P-loop NTPase fold protein [Nocardioides coralli]|uniref:KAP family P-loop NTPase fold protein n=1 Tax=Nocardioides coralli TaxID=2872154 RepID=UPI001CA4270D|nr:P-loop NTPase fold protein [Nocardioides coralli]QZY28969.1 KAP family NTPase [Nocardioides coralli]